MINTICCNLDNIHAIDEHPCFYYNFPIFTSFIVIYVLVLTKWKPNGALFYLLKTQINNCIMKINNCIKKIRTCLLSYFCLFKWQLIGFHMHCTFWKGSPHGWKWMISTLKINTKYHIVIFGEDINTYNPGIHHRTLACLFEPVKVVPLTVLQKE